MALPTRGLHGAYLRCELVERIGRRQLANALAAHELRPLWRGTVVEAARLLDPWTRAAAAQLSLGSRAVTTGVTAAYLHGCRSVDPANTHVLLPYRHQARRRPGLVIHYSGAIFDEHVEELDGIRVLPFDRAIAELLCTLPPPDALAVADESLRLAGDEHGEFRERVATELAIRWDHRGTVRGAGLLDLASERAESPAESWIRMMIIERGLPIPEVNWPINALDGREIYRLDLAWPELRIALEYDGHAFHVDREAEDAARVADLRKRGWIVVRAGAADLRDLGRVMAELRAAFARRGYVLKCPTRRARTDKSAC